MKAIILVEKLNKSVNASKPSSEPKQKCLTRLCLTSTQAFHYPMLATAQTYKTDELAHPGDNVLKLFVSVNYNDKLMHDVIQIVKIKLPRNGMSWWSSG